MIEKKLFNEEKPNTTEEKNKVKKKFKHLVVVGHPDQNHFVIMVYSKLS